VGFQTDASRRRGVGKELTRPASSRVKIDIGIVGLSNFPSGAAEGNRASWDFEGCKKSWISARQIYFPRIEEGAVSIGLSLLTRLRIDL
jgi:hypothetical protein